MRRALLLFVMIIAVSYSFAIKSERNVLVITSYHQTYSWEKNLIKALNQTLKSSKYQLNLYYEHLDILRIPFQQKEYTEYFNIKYKQTYFDVVICVDDAAFNFVTQNYKDVFIGKVIIFCGVNNFHKNLLPKEMVNITGINERIDAYESTKALLDLLPGIKKIYIYGDNSSLYQINKRIVIEDLHPLRDRIKLNFINDFDINQFKQHSKSLDKESAIFIISPIKDQYGDIIQPVERAAEILAKDCKVPIISFWDFWMGHGILGGKLVSAESQGILSGKQALAILEGKPVKDLPIIYKSPNQFMFDYQQLKKFKVNFRKLPRQSIIINQPSQLYQISRMWLLVISSLFLITITFLIILLIQIRKRSKLQQLNKENIIFLETFLNTIPNPVFYKDTHGVFIFCNPAFEELFGYSKDEIIGKKSHEFQHYDFVEKHYEYEKPLLNGEKEIIHYEFTLKNSKGDERFVIISKASVRNLKGEITGIIGAISDITQNKNAEKQIIKQMHELELKNKEMESFIYTVSHDLKSPLITIKGFLSFLEKDFTSHNTDQFNKDLHKISNAAHRMHDILEDLLQLSRIGRVISDPESFKMNSILDELMIMLSGIIKESNAQITYPEEMPECYGDKNRIREIWQNLIENAIKYKQTSEDPIISITFEKTKDQMIYSIEDNGIGIPDAQKEKVFDLFEKINPDSPGTGIGLARVKKIIDLYQGHIWIENSKKGHGSVFKFYLSCYQGKSI